MAGHLMQFIGSDIIHTPTRTRVRIQIRQHCITGILKLFTATVTRCFIHFLTGKNLSLLWRLLWSILHWMTNSLRYQQLEAVTSPIADTYWNYYLDLSVTWSFVITDSPIIGMMKMTTRDYWQRLSQYTWLHAKGISFHDSDPSLKDEEFIIGVVTVILMNKLFLF